MRRTKSSDSSAVPGSMWLNSRSREKEPARTRLGGSLMGCEGTRSISITILAPVTDSEGDGQGGRRSKSRKKKRSLKRVLTLPATNIRPWPPATSSIGIASSRAWPSITPKGRVNCRWPPKRRREEITGTLATGRDKLGLIGRGRFYEQHWA